MSAIDPRAKKILFDRFWSPRGWIDEGARQTPAEDRAYAMRLGMMFDPVTTDHDALLSMLRDDAESISTDDAAGAFLASLSTRRLDLRSGLASLVIARSLRAHALRPRGLRASLCATCGASATYQDEDLDVLNFERHKWGGVRRTDPLYLALDLRELRRALPSAPTADDLAIFARVREVIASSAPKDAPPKLSKRLRGVLPSAKAERDMLVEILAAIGVLVASDPHRRSGDFECAAAWRGADGYDAAAVRRLFGAHGVAG